MDIDVMAMKIRDLMLANQLMGVQIGELLEFKADAERRLVALEPEKPAAEHEPIEVHQPDENASEVPPAEPPAGEPQEAHEGYPAPTPADNPAEASPDAPQATEQP
ncbi:hypothetical protein AB4037_23390 [Labrys sp. KB_33_2]|uniref:hypothetical protein n=1 Tax=Labrys sp. KB_33_2 TaxID=3237479 RepID=UPI003F9363B5